MQVVFNEDFMEKPHRHQDLNLQPSYLNHMPLGVSPFYGFFTSFWPIANLFLKMIFIGATVHTNIIQSWFLIKRCNQLMKFRPFFLPWIKMSLFFFHARRSLVAFQLLFSLSLDVSIDDVFYLEQVSIQISFTVFFTYWFTLSITITYLSW